MAVTVTTAISTYFALVATCITFVTTTTAITFTTSITTIISSSSTNISSVGFRSFSYAMPSLFSFHRNV